MIPKQLQRPEFRFVLIPRGSKAPCQKHWTTTSNYGFDEPKLIKWLQSGGNYGVCCGFGNLVGIDADDPIIARIFERHFGSTFRVRSGSGRGFHDYVIVPGLRGKLQFERDGQHLSEAQCAGQQLVGPGSVHPSGGSYTVVRDVPIVNIDSPSFLKAFAGFLRPKAKMTTPVQTRWRPTGSQQGIQSLPLSAVLSIRGIRRREEIHGSNPWHGSTTGHNFSLNMARNVWHCFRCNAGGGVAKAIALNAGIIRRCDDTLTPADFRKVMAIVRRFRTRQSLRSQTQDGPRIRS
jgi:Bifunctional DNA primase/polymerase, N-terminal